MPKHDQGFVVGWNCRMTGFIQGFVVVSYVQGAQRKIFPKFNK